MARLARVVAPGYAHHVTQRGTDRQRVFHTDSDRRVYLDLLSVASARARLKILAYCLMPNHVHLIVVPEEPTSLSVALRRTHGRYANYLNARRGRSGHLWQNRFYSCPLEHPRLFVALAYVERNPVRAGMVEKPEQYAWSSAKAHLTGEAAGWLDMELWRETGGAARWQGLLASPEDLLTIRQLQRGTFTGRPVGSDAFVADIETMLQRRLRPQQGVALVARARC